MGVDPGQTTVTVASTAPHHGAASPDLALVWVFPQPSRAPERLRAEGEQERIIGRDETCAICLPGGDVSRRHATLRAHPTNRSPGASADAVTVVEVRDLQSRNGVRVNGRNVASSVLQSGDVVRFGGWVAVVADRPATVQAVAPGLWGGGALQRALAPLQRAAASDLPIILEGETGTGKEIVASSIHGWSGRAGALVAVNCAALPEALAEGELFGYRRGAFTGADKPSQGHFRSADQGTLLLDEINDLSLPVQAKLLRVLEQRQVQPLGEARPIDIDVRVVVAGQSSLVEAARQGRFRPDLLARLEGVTVRLPPLRERREDVAPLFSHFIGQLGQGRAPAIDADFVEALCLYDWPFNVRELLLVARRLMVLHGDRPTWRLADLPERIAKVSSDLSSPAAPALLAAPASPDLPTPAGVSDAVELPALLAALRACAGNVARAAATLGITRQRAYRLMDSHAVDLEALRKEDRSAVPTDGAG